MRVFEAKYASIDLLKDKKSILIQWKAIVSITQYKLVAELIMQLLRKHKIDTIAEDQSNFQANNKKEIQQFFIDSLIPRYSSMNIENYWLKSPVNLGNGFNAVEVAYSTQRFPIQFKMFEYTDEMVSAL